ncbi:MAG: aspartate aminotransferase family protein [Caulobacteraceae bacterium]|nr:aspartate aminotransferase family protein [Caulobacteraceae bacterium]
MGVYNRAPLAFERGEGARLYGTNGQVYLDCVGGIATDALGHCNPVLVKALTEQANKLWHISNIYQIPGQEELADKLVANSFADVVFFTNSGTEAVECALKTCRKFHSANGADPAKIDIIGFDGSFHGRTYAAVNAAGNPSYTDGFGPRLPGYSQCKFGDMEMLESMMGPNTAGIIIEPVQGEGGARAVSDADLRKMRELCDKWGALLIFDEVQSGMGRTGKLWAHEWSGVTPDIMAIAKALGGGFPIGACLATSEAAKGMIVGAHGSTFGGNPLAMAVGIASFNEINSKKILDNVNEIAGYLNQQLTGLKDRFPDVIVDIRGKGLLVGVKLIPNNREFMAIAREHNLLVAGGGDNLVRLLPPLNLTLDEAREAIQKFEQACETARAKAAA